MADTMGGGSPEKVSTITDFDVDEGDDVPISRSRNATHKSELPAAAPGGSARCKRNNAPGHHSGMNHPISPAGDRFKSFQAVVAESLDETQRLKRLSQKDGENLGAGVIVDTVKEVATAASGAYASIREWANNQQQQQQRSASSSFEGGGSDQHHRGKHITTPLATNIGGGLPYPHPSATTSASESVGTGSHLENHPSQNGVVEKNSIIQDLSWPFALCGIDVSGSLPKQNELGPHLQKMREAVVKVVHVDMGGAANDIWRFASPSNPDDDDNTQYSLDTLQEENNQIRRLGSWGTIGTAGTFGTNMTGDADSIASIDHPKTPMEIKFEDDDGNAINPLIFEKAKKSREKRKPRRRLVKFDYPPIKSLRQCPRPDPETLPDLFFTEHELDQIEDDRYSTMSTDDIEIVAVASKPGEGGQSSSKKSRSPKSKARIAPGTAGTDDSGNPRDQPEPGFRQVKGRPSTPYRRRANTEDDEDPEISAENAKSSDNGRLVKGVQIYLRERSTGA